MRRLWVFLLVGGFCASAGASVEPALRRISPQSMPVPAFLSSSGETETIEWGCPVMNVVVANTSAEALSFMSKACLAEAHREVKKQTGIVDVIRTSVIYPDIKITHDEKGFLLQGTFFLETVVLKTNTNK